MRTSLGVTAWLPLVLLTACVAPHTGEHPAVDRLLTSGDIQVAEKRLRDFGFDPGPVDENFTTQTRAAIRAFQAHYGLPVSRLLERTRREELRPGVAPKRTD